MDFNIEQVALYIPGGDKQFDAKLREYRRKGHDFTEDLVTAQGKVFDSDRSVAEEVVNVARLAFNYTVFPGMELELIQYKAGDNWLMNRYTAGRPRLSHMGTHVDSVDEFKRHNPNLPVIQEVRTLSHTNPATRGRHYHYVIFDTLELFGFDFKIIQRIMPKEGEQP